MKDLVEEFWDLLLVDPNRVCASHQMASAMHCITWASRSAADRERPGRHYGSCCHAQRGWIAETQGVACEFQLPCGQGSGPQSLIADTFDFATPNGRIDWEAVASRLTSEHTWRSWSRIFWNPTDFTASLPGARRKAIIEDCAHALGASIAGTTAGLLGDAAVFSFNYDKPISPAGVQAAAQSPRHRHRPGHSRCLPDRGAASVPADGGDAALYATARAPAARWHASAPGCTYFHMRRRGFRPGRVPCVRLSGSGSSSYHEVRDHRNRNARFLQDSLGRISPASLPARSSPRT